MLRFDVPQVWSNVIRWEAFITSVVCVLALAAFPWAMLLPVVQGLVRGFFGHHRCPAHLLWKKVAEGKQWGGKKENAGAKMFANKILFVVSSIAMLLWLSGNPLWTVPTVALLVFSTMEWAFSFCVACWAYGFWYQRFPPKMG